MKKVIVSLTVLLALVGITSVAQAAKPVNSAPADACVQMITYAVNPETGEVVAFPTPCDVPEGWEVVPPPTEEASL